MFSGLASTVMRSKKSGDLEGVLCSPGLVENLPARSKVENQLIHSSQNTEQFNRLLDIIEGAKPEDYLVRV